MKIKGYRFPCEVCGNNEVVSSIQVFFNKSGIVKYGRARHYLGQKDGKPQFEYHQQSIEYIKQKLSTLEIGHIGQEVNVDLDKPELTSKLGLVAGGEGFEPSTPNLGGWCSLREDIKTKRDPPLC
jgi:hypothetical protein